MPEITLSVNGVEHRLEVEPRRLLVHVLREDLGLTGTHVGCDTSSCGACTIHVDGDAALSCTILAVQADGSEIRTVEGLAEDGALGALQLAFHEQHALQCGFCTPGMLMAAADLIAKADGPLDEAAIRAGLEGNLCRCTGYQNIVRAVEQASRHAVGV